MASDLTNPAPFGPQEVEPLPCPFCEHEAHLSRSTLTGFAENYAVACGNGDCGARTMFWRTPGEALATWNRRSAPVQQPEAQP